MAGFGHVRGTKHMAYRNNDMYAEKLGTFIKGLPKAVLGAYAATALNNAILETFYDSSRAGANWNLKIGNAPPPTNWDPKKYKEFPVGERGTWSEKSHKDTLNYKAFIYGYKTVNGFQVPIKGMFLHASLGIGVKGTAPRVVLYNPIFSPEYMPYVKNAFGSSSEEILTRIARGEKGVPIDQIDKSFLPLYIQELASEIKKAHASGRI